MNVSFASAACTATAAVNVEAVTASSAVEQGGVTACTARARTRRSLCLTPEGLGRRCVEVLVLIEEEVDEVDALVDSPELAHLGTQSYGEHSFHLSRSFESWIRVW